MSNVDVELQRAFPAEARSLGGTLYFRISDSRRVIDFCRDRGWVVLGLEGFHIDGSVITPDLDHVADLSKAADPSDQSRYIQATAAAAHRILDAWAKDDPSLCVEIVAESSLNSHHTAPGTIS